MAAAVSGTDRTDPHAPVSLSTARTRSGARRSLWAPGSRAPPDTRHEARRPSGDPGRSPGGLPAGQTEDAVPPPEQHGPDLAALILEGEIQMPRGRGSQIGHFALHPDIGERLFQPVPDQEGQLGNGENLSRVRAHKSSGV